MIHSLNGNIGANNGNPFALSLTSGGWDVIAPNGDIYLEEVRNPNGDFNDAPHKIGQKTNPYAFLFTYTPQAYVVLSANGVFLGTSGSLPRMTGEPVPVLYPPILNITADTGGVTLENNVTLFPSPSQNLDIVTMNGGNLSATASATGAPYYLLMSDSAQTQWQNSSTFSVTDHGSLANEPNDSSSALINISGNMENLNLITTKATDITVGGGMTNCGFSGQNLQSSDVTSINVAGQIYNTNPPSSEFQLGYLVGGPGQFHVNAGSISLGNSEVILSGGIYDPSGFQRYGNLASITPEGATINVTVSSNLDMVSSSIASLDGSDVNVVSTTGSMDLGFPESLNGLTFGIYTTGGGNVNVTADGDINVAGSRIATYDGGNIFIESLTGNVNVGSGTADLNTIYSVYSGESSPYVENVYGSGIIALTLAPPSPGEVFPPNAATNPGNITVETPEGNIIALSAAGILQEPLSGSVSAGPTITLTAGIPGFFGSPGYIGNIILGSDGVIGETVNWRATGIIGEPALNTSISQSGGRFLVSWNASNVQLDSVFASDFEIESSPDLVNWQVINPAITATANGGLSFESPASTNSSCFYRVQWQ